MSSLKIIDVSKNYGSVEVLKHIHLEVQSGEFVVFVGPSGCGKSTLLRMIAGLEPITRGDIYLGEQRINDIDAAKRGVAMVFQSYALYPHMSVAENMSFSLRLSGATKAQQAQAVREVARILQLEDLLERKPAQLSGGQKQRVAIGRAIVRKPELFLFDEPLSNLDAELRVQMRAELALLHKSLGNTMIYVTHDQVEAMTLADKMVVLKDGIVQQIGRPLQLYDEPDNMFVAGFIGTPQMNFIKARIVSINEDGMQVHYGEEDTPTDRLTLPPVMLPPASQLSQGQKIWLGIRPEHIALCDIAAPDALSLRVNFIEELGESTSLHASLGKDVKLRVLTHGKRHDGGEHIGIKLDPHRILLFDENGVRLAPKAAS